MKKFLCMMMAVLMVVAMAACGSEPTNNGGNDTESTTVKIGGIGPMTGPYANYGLSEKYAAELAVKEINEAGGIMVS